MQTIAFSSGDFPRGFDDRARISAWRDFLAATYAPHEVSGLPDHPFEQHLRGTRFDVGATPVDVLRFSGTMDRVSWRRGAKAAPGAAQLVLCFNQHYQKEDQT
jgi:hypothetical protein